MEVARNRKLNGKFVGTAASVRKIAYELWVSESRGEYRGELAIEVTFMAVPI